MSCKVKYKDGKEETIAKAKEWELYDECFARFLDEDDEEICCINIDVIAKIE